MLNLHFSFNFQKSLQASLHLLRLAGGRMWNIDLLKMLYIADRESLAEEGHTITGDFVNALPRGPILRTVLNLIKNKDSQSEQWHYFIGTCYNVSTRRLDVFAKKYVPLEEGELCRFEKEILDRVFQEHRGKDLVAYTHTFLEWKKYEESINSSKKKSYPITIQDILEGIGKPELIERVKRNVAEQKYYSKLFGVAR